ncbi:hypothetical protein [Azospirillum sp.]|uniref:hypothetical protein n=1 Tax=Azospirillum sp. TaxID=34012 RepID=UPI002D6C59FD|nr:hypothetical protein [Azospirillum sp.]HYD69283.1 hypothetical protein [Azospirillum sp.]
MSKALNEPSSPVSIYNTVPETPFPFTVHHHGDQLGHELVMGPIAEAMTYHLMRRPDDARVTERE